MIDFKQITTDDKLLFNKLANACPQRGCEMSFANLFLWDDQKIAYKKEHLLFFISVFRKSALSKGFDYGNKFRRDIAINIKVKLPVNDDESLDFEYMESFMKKIQIKVNNNLNNLISLL